MKITMELTDMTLRVQEALSCYCALLKGRCEDFDVNGQTT